MREKREQARSPFYPRPGIVGGSLIREVIRFLRTNGVELPITSHILIGVSGGPDSLALAHLLIRYGRRVAPREKISIVHINHGWRGERSDQDERFVEEFATRMGVSFDSARLDPTHYKEGDSWEERARTDRKEVFARLAHERNALILTAHHADDLAETVLWRILTGAAETHSGGIVVRHGPELRPLLSTPKAQLLRYLHEENESYRTDETNQDRRFLRARIRSDIMPILERIFPRASEHLTQLGLKAQGGKGQSSGLTALFGASGVALRRSHWESIGGCSPDWRGRLDLPEGWQLRRELCCVSSKKEKTERWILERLSPG